MSIRKRLAFGLCGLISLMFLLTGVLASLVPVTFRIDHDWLSPLVIILGAGVYLGGVGLAFRWFHRLSKPQHRYLNLALWTLLLTIQLFVAVNWIPAPRADLYFVHQQAISLLAGSHHWASYFYTYPNNVSFTLLLSGLLQVGRWLTGGDSGVWLNLVQFAWLDCGLFAVWQVLTKKNPARGHLFLGIVLGTVPLYAYALNTYSDTFVLPMGLLTIVLVHGLLHAQTWQQTVPRALGLGIILTLTYLLKANFIVLIIATVLIIWLLPNATTRPFLTRGWVTLLLLAVLAGGVASNRTVQQAAGYQSNPSQALPATSWIAMSWNPAYYGQYNRHDVGLIMAQPTATTKQAQAKTDFKDYLHQLGPRGIIQHLYRKAKLFLATGTFDSFQISPAYDRAPIWYRQHRNTVDWLLANWCQINYLALLIVNFGWGIQQIRRRKFSTGYLLGGLFIIGLTCFHVIFWETEERYALPLLPLLIAGTAAGYRQPLNLLRWSQRSSWLPLGLAIGFTAALGIGARQNYGLVTQPRNHPVSVISQNEGRYYQNHKVRLQQNQQLTQPFTASLTFNHVLINNGDSFTGVITLRTATGKLVWQTRGAKVSLAQNLPRPLPAGRYTLTLTAKRVTPQKIGTAPANYPLLAQPLTTHPHQYLRFFIDQRSVSPILTPSKLWLIIGVLWLGGLVIIDRFYWYRRHI
ncbi:hypothetical protein [Levilactobacillus sp. N40-8-2]|uniref:hypothetical protein n=1 Tax=Levilactobacillus muriae TaxID=3238987 RepID=UPI0038B3B1F4